MRQSLRMRQQQKVEDVPRGGSGERLMMIGKGGRQIPIIWPYLNVQGPTGRTVALYLEDCVEGMPSLPSTSMDVVVTSPPCNIGPAHNGHHDRLSREDYLAWIAKVGKQIHRMLAKEGSFFLNLGGISSDPWIPLDVAQMLRKQFVLQNVIHWVKSIDIGKCDVGDYPSVKGTIAASDYGPAKGSRFLNDCHEYIFHFTKMGRVTLDGLSVGLPYQDKSNIGRWSSTKEDKRGWGNTWFIPHETIPDLATQRHRPSSFPPGLPEMCIKLHGVNKTENVLDPFIGTGSTAIACLRLGVSCVGFDTDAEYLQVAAERIRAQLAWDRPDAALAGDGMAPGRRRFLEPSGQRRSVHTGRRQS